MQIQLVYKDSETRGFRTALVRARPTMRVAHLFPAASQIIGLPESEIRFIFQGEQLDYRKTLAGMASASYYTWSCADCVDHQIMA